MKLDIHEILRRLPYRYPFLLMDRVLKLEAGKRIEALKNVTINEALFQGHFPHLPVMLGVLLLEALAQTAASHSRLSVKHLTTRRCTTSAESMQRDLRNGPNPGIS